MKVVVGMSGGVDSSVSALLLKQQGFDVIGLFMKNWEESSSQGTCTATKDFEDVVRVCETLDIPHYSVNFIQEYWDLVFSQFLEELRLGFTPNPDVLCNREIKFHCFFAKAKQIGANALATGHYAQTNAAGLLYKSVDSDKDQTYFLHTLQSKTLQEVLFPIGHLPKQEVRRLAAAHGLATAAKKDSTGICFIGKRDFKPFISQYIPYQKGLFLSLEGKKLGEHEGMAYYTLGQRKGLGIGGPGEAWFVVDKDPVQNIVYLVQGEDHPALYAEELTADELSWVSPTPPSFPLRCKAKIRYRQPEQECLITLVRPGTVHVRFTIPQRAITLRQSIVFYEGSLCLGGARIASRGPSLHESHPRSSYVLSSTSC
ncbi:MAG: tRNA 2-thiouridine(34) synthase MnmA [Chlamydiae bacterium]|jgi:tRNA-specific 2-thiouridylase|nr:tRNA 2-thiouridine(34) synthase MnmA [Chlamydiota bacterium]